MIRLLLHLLLLGGALVSAVSTASELQLPVLGGGYAIPVTSIKEARFRATLLQQYDFSCGSAALATLLTHQYGIPISEETVFQAMYAQGDQAKIRHEGFSLLDMKRYLASLGFTADGFTQSLDKLAEAGLPAIVLINDKGYHHFVVVKGIRDDRILLGDPATGTRAMDRASFEASWVNRLLFVIHNRTELARFNLDNDWRAVPRAPLVAGVQREGLANVTLPKFGSSDF